MGVAQYPVVEVDLFEVHSLELGDSQTGVVEQGEDQEIPLVIRAQKLINSLIEKGIYTRTEFIEQGQ